MPIDQEQIIRTSLNLIDNHGLEYFTLKALARELNIKAPSLYNHIHSKIELLAEVAKTLLLEATYPGDSKLEWREVIVQVCLETRRVILRHPRAASLLLQFPPRELLLRAYEHSLKYFHTSEKYYQMISEGVEKLTFGSAVLAAASVSREGGAGLTVDAGRFPRLAAAVKANPYPDEEELFVQTLRWFLDSFPDA